MTSFTGLIFLESCWTQCLVSRAILKYQYVSLLLRGCSCFHWWHEHEGMHYNYVEMCECLQMFTFLKLFMLQYECLDSFITSLYFYLRDMQHILNFFCQSTKSKNNQLTMGLIIPFVPHAFTLTIIQTDCIYFHICTVQHTEDSQYKQKTKIKYGL